MSSLALVIGGLAWTAVIWGVFAACLHEVHRAWPPIRNWWWAKQRAADLATLWPICKQEARDLNHAKVAFMTHAINSPCWVRHYGENLWRAVDALV